MAEPEDGTRERGTRAGNLPDLPLIIEQMQNQLDDLREVVARQQRQLAEHRERLDALEHR